ncbi:MAG: acyloxyacyl hydrolase [Verrucomicrobiota bacterium]
MKRVPLLLLFSAALCSAGDKQPITGRTVVEGLYDPADHWSVDVQTGVIWQAGVHTSINYVILPQIISIRTPEHFRMTLGEGDLTLRAGFNLLVEPIARGPETGYLGFSFSPSLEYWLPSKKTAFFVSSGGGAGWVDSQDNVPGAQGQDFTLNWFAQAGVRCYLRPNLAISASCFFQHLSNGGATTPNPGIDGVGPMFGMTWHF